MNDHIFRFRLKIILILTMLLLQFPLSVSSGAAYQESPSFGAEQEPERQQAILSSTPHAGYNDTPIIGIDLSRWMEALPDRRLITELSIPGTHDSGATHDDIDDLDLAAAQSASISEQLKAGVRAFDLRLYSKGEEPLCIFHGFYYQQQCFQGVMGEFRDFLAAHNKETVIVSISEEVFDAINGGPNPANPLFFDNFLREVEAYGKDIHGNSFVWKPAGALTDIKTINNVRLGDVRGKMIIIDEKHKAGPNASTPLAVWGGAGDSVTVDDATMHYYDRLVSKWVNIEHHLDDANRKGYDKTYRSFLSASSAAAEDRSFMPFLPPYRVSSGHMFRSTNIHYTFLTTDACSAWPHHECGCIFGVCSVTLEGINEIFTNQWYQDDPRRQRLGIVYSDFPGKVLVQDIVNTNFKWVDITGGPYRGFEDVPVTFSPKLWKAPSSFGNPEEDLYYNWDFGDGSPLTSPALWISSSYGPYTDGLPTAIHTYTEPGVYTVTLTAWRYSVPSVYLQNKTTVEVESFVEAHLDSPMFIEEGGSAEVIGYYKSQTPLEPGDITIAWGSGEALDTYFDIGTTSVWWPTVWDYSLTYQYPDDSPSGTTSDEKHIVITSTVPGYGTHSTDLYVTVINVSPYVQITSSSVAENSMATINGMITDPGTWDSFTLTVDWGGGAPIVYTYPLGTTTFTLSHQYPDSFVPGVSFDYDVTVTVMDDDGGDGIDTINIQVLYPVFLPAIMKE